jgi:DNA polymerase I-like protein with 3'-5' exonuclease and polymerase domains
MRQKGIRVDLDKAEKTKKFLQQKEDKLLKQVKDETGVDIEPWTATSLAKAFDALNLTYERTEKSNAPSFTKHFLKTHKHPIAKKILEIREYNKANTTFIETILNHQYKGRIHCEFNQLRSDDGGTVTGRFSSSHPNLQQVPARHPEIKKMIRGLFLPEEGDKWASLDYSAQEPRWLMHYASLTPATKDNTKVQEIVASYKKDDIDFHQMVADMADIDRNLAKTINLGIMYGMGIGKLAHILGDISFDEAKSLRAEYDEKVPFIKEMASAVMRVATEKGEIRTLLGRKCRFPMREPKGFGGYKKVIHMDKLEEEWQNIMDTPLEEREKDWRKKNPANYQVAFTYKALNRLIQSSSADQTKRAMIVCHNEGFMPMLTVHDELCFSVSESSKVDKIKTLMENCFPEMKIPSKIDVEVGDSWGE